MTTLEHFMLLYLHRCLWWLVSLCLPNCLDINNYPWYARPSVHYSPSVISCQASIHIVKLIIQQNNQKSNLSDLIGPLIKVKLGKSQWKEKGEGRQQERSLWLIPTQINFSQWQRLFPQSQQNKTKLCAKYIKLTIAWPKVMSFYMSLWHTIKEISGIT